MASNYISDSILIDTRGIKFKPSFDIKKFSFYTEEGNFRVRLRCSNIWGPWINGFPYVEVSDAMDCLEIEVQSLEHSLHLHYYIRGEK